jgi:hypothetical protein
MIRVLTYKPVNWVDGMKLSRTHFIATDQHTQDLVRDARSLWLTKYNFGLLPMPFEMDMIVKATDHVEIRVSSCHAITAEGCRIEIGQPLVYNHHFTGDTRRLYNVFLGVNPFERVPAGILDPAEDPPRYPDITQGYHIAVIPADEMAPSEIVTAGLIVGQLLWAEGKINTVDGFIPASSSVMSHPLLSRYYEAFHDEMNELQICCFTIMDKTHGGEVTALGRNIRLLSEKMLDHLSKVLFEYRNTGYQQPPVYIAGQFSNLAHVFFSAIRMIAPKEREEMLKYFYEWRDITPGNFEELLARTIELIYNHQDIQAAMTLVAEFMKVVTALWKKLSTLEYIGKRKENIVVAEQQIVQQVQSRRTWTLLD